MVENGVPPGLRQARDRQHVSSTTLLVVARYYEPGRVVTVVRGGECVEPPVPDLPGRDAYGIGISVSIRARAASHACR